MLIVNREKILPSIGTLHFLCLKYIFDKHNMPIEETAVLQEGIESYSKQVDLNPMDKWEIKRIVNALVADEKGYWDRSKMLQKIHGVDYRKMYDSGIPFVDADNRKFFNKS